MIDLILAILAISAIICGALTCAFFSDIGNALVSDNVTSFILGIVFLVLTIAFSFGTIHNWNWENRKWNFKDKYHISHLIHLGNKTAEYVTKDERQCTAKVAYKPSKPHGDLYIIEDSIKCEDPPKLKD